MITTLRDDYSLNLQKRKLQYKKEKKKKSYFNVIIFIVAKVTLNIFYQVILE